MHLFLSSQNFGNHPDVLVAMARNKRVAYIGNAKDYWGSEERKAKVAEHRAQFEGLGFEFNEFDLRDYFGKAQQLENDLDGRGLVWLSGGNTFLLRRAMKDSGLDGILISKLQHDEIVLGGSSAGSIVMTPSLKGTELGDDPDEVDNIYHKELIWDGLNLVPFYVVPHYKSEWFGEEADAMVKYLKNLGLQYKALKDGEVFIVDGEKQELLK